jgi:type 1 glutamine amidotransferase
VRWGERVPAAAQAGSPLVGWARQHGPSRIVYVLPGHTASTMTHPGYRTIVRNACEWVAASSR